MIISRKSWGVVAVLRNGGTRGDDDSDSDLADSGDRFTLLPPVEVSPTAMLTVGAATIETSGYAWKFIEGIASSGWMLRKAEEEVVAVFYGRRRERRGAPPGRRRPLANQQA